MIFKVVFTRVVGCIRQNVEANKLWSVPLVSCKNIQPSNNVVQLLEESNKHMLLISQITLTSFTCWLNNAFDLLTWHFVCITCINYFFTFYIYVTYRRAPAATILQSQSSPGLSTAFHFLQKSSFSSSSWFPSWRTKEKRRRTCWLWRRMKKGGGWHWILNHSAVPSTANMMCLWSPESPSHDWFEWSLWNGNHKTRKPLSRRVGRGSVISNHGLPKIERHHGCICFGPSNWKTV